MNICLLKTGMYWNVDGWYASVEYGCFQIQIVGGAVYNVTYE